MIIDILDNAERYLTLHEGFAEAFRFLRRHELHELPPGRYPIDGERIYAVIANDPGRKREDSQLETHMRYIDIQLILAGTDIMGWRPKSFCIQPAGEYDGVSDLQFYADQPESWLAAGSGMFVIFFPEDAHMPLISPGRIHKVIVKIAVDRQ